MKAFGIALFSVALALFFPLLSFATHNRTAEIKYRHVSGFTYEATIITYTSASSTQADRDTVNIDWDDGPISALVRVNGPVGGNGVPKGEVLAGNYDLKYNEYAGTHTFPGPGDYRISLTDPNRTSNIININGGASANLMIYVESLVRVPANGACVNNSSVSILPSFLGGKVNAPLKVSVASSDTDGDSLTYELIVPQAAQDAPVPNYQYPNEVLPGINNQFELNPKNGEITWYNPQRVGIYSIAVRVSEWRDGKLVGAVNKEAMFIIDDFNVDAPTITGTELWNKDADSNFYYAINPGDTLALSFLATQSSGFPDVNAYGEIFHQPVLPSFLTHQMGADLHAMFTWVPDSQSARVSPYVLVFRVGHDTELLQENITVLVKVNGGSSYACADVVGILSPKPQSELRLTPNPFSESAVIQLPENSAVRQVILSLYDLAGKLVMKYNQPYEQNLRLNRNGLSEGIYILKVDDLNGKNLGIVRVAIIE